MLLSSPPTDNGTCVMALKKKQRSTVLLLSVSRMQEKFKLQMTAVLEQLATWPSTASRSTHNETANASGQRELTTDKAWPSINVKE